MASVAFKALSRFGGLSAAALSLTLLAACGTDAPAAGSIVCSASADCPDGSVCDGGFCVASTNVTDSSVSDTGTAEDTALDSTADTTADTTTDTTPDIDPALCGNGVIDGAEACDTAIAAGQPGACPTSCDAGASCTTVRLEGTDCAAACVTAPLAECVNGDGCCGDGCSAADDDDCDPVCGNTILEPGELCDPSESCPTEASCADSSACTAETVSGSAASCDAACVISDITLCVSGDGCCPSSCTNATDSDCSASCGNGVVEPGETCDGNCPTSCAPSNVCATARLIGSAGNCSAECVEAAITAPADADGCCPDGANASVDNDCSAVCGNGVVEGIETCDGACPTSCNDTNACTTDSVVGSAASCNAACDNAPVTVCTNGDGCCAPGCNASNDNDCSAACGNGILEPGETCEGASCPTSCDDGLACTANVLVGSAGNCDLACTFPAIVNAADGDGCCPAIANANNDNDCAPVCDNDVVEFGETCDPLASCPVLAACEDGDFCTIDTLDGAACGVACARTTITTPSSGDLCCPFGANANLDTDCDPTCGNSVVESGELCDGACPTSCPDDGNLCTGEVLTGTTGTCDALCTHPAITACANADGCCAPGCTSANDTDCVSAIDTNSPVTVTSSCLTLGLPGPAQGAILVTLRDARGNAVNAATVSMSTTLGTLSAVSSSGNEYWATLSAPGTGAGTATISVTANGIALATRPAITIADRFSDVTGGTGGCGADGNVRVRAVDPAGNPIAGAVVMVGTAPAATSLVTTYRGAASGSNNATTDADGYAVFRDFGTTLDGTVTVTAGAANREYVTFTSSNAADFVLPLRPLRPTVQTGTYAGVLSGINASGNIEAGLMLADTDLNNLATFSFAGLLSRNACVAIPIVGNAAVPNNVYLPRQTVIILTLAEKRYASAATTYGNRFLYGLGGNLPTSAVTGGNLTAALGTLTLTNFGGATATVNAAGPTTRDIALSTTLRNNVGCSLSNYPAASDVFCVSVGDIDSGGASALTPGEGRLIFNGFKTAVAGTNTATAVNLANLTTVDNVGALANMDYLAITAAFYNDKARAGIPAGAANGTSAIFNRAGADLFAGNPTVSFNNYLPIRSVARTSRAFTLGAATNATSPAAPDFTELNIKQVVNTTYTGCAANDSTESTRYPVWRVIAPATATAVSLPTLPAGWPRATLAGDLSGLVDTTATAENDSLEVTVATTDMGLLPGFSYGAFRFADFVKYATHVSSNQAGF